MKNGKRENKKISRSEGNEEVHKSKTSHGIKRKSVKIKVRFNDSDSESATDILGFTIKTLQKKIGRGNKRSLILSRSLDIYLL